MSSPEPVPKRWQFSLSTLLGVLLLCAIVFGLIVNASTEYQVTVRYLHLPADDQRLEDWLASQDGVHDVVVRREGNSVRARYSRRGLTWSSGMVDPPWAKLGYSDIEAMSWAVMHQGLLGGISNWISQLPVGVLIVLGLLVTGFVFVKSAWQRIHRADGGDSLLL